MPVNLKQGNVITPLPDDAIIDLVSGNHPEDPYRINVTQNSVTDTVWMLKLKPLSLTYNNNSGLLTWNDTRVQTRPTLIDYRIFYHTGPSGYQEIGKTTNSYSFNLKDVNINTGLIMVEAKPQNIAYDYISPSSASIDIRPPQPPEPPTPEDNSVVFWYELKVDNNNHYLFTAGITDAFGELKNHTNIRFNNTTIPLPSTIDTLDIRAEGTLPQSPTTHTVKIELLYDTFIGYTETFVIKKNQITHIKDSKTVFYDPPVHGTVTMACEEWADYAQNSYHYVVNVVSVSGNLDRNKLLFEHTGGDAQVVGSGEIGIEWAGSPPGAIAIASVYYDGILYGDNILYFECYVWPEEPEHLRKWQQELKINEV